MTSFSTNALFRSTSARGEDEGDRLLLRDVLQQGEEVALCLSSAV
jgi:hypothetical protein